MLPYHHFDSLQISPLTIPRYYEMALFVIHLHRSQFEFEALLRKCPNVQYSEFSFAGRKTTTTTNKSVSQKYCEICISNESSEIDCYLNFESMEDRLEQHVRDNIKFGCPSVLFTLNELDRK